MLYAIRLPAPGAHALPPRQEAPAVFDPRSSILGPHGMGGAGGMSARPPGGRVSAAPVSPGRLQPARAGSRRPVRVRASGQLGIGPAVAADGPGAVVAGRRVP